MFGSSNKKNKGKRKSKKKNQDAAYENQQFDIAVSSTDPPPEMFETDANGVPYGETERALLRLHQNLIDFYSKHNPSNVNEEVLTILMQFFIDAGGVALNRKLMNKYGEDLQTFKRLEQPPPLPPDVVDSRRTSATLDRMKRASVNQDLNEMGIDVPPPPSKIETTATRESIRESRESKTAPVQATFDHRPKKRVINDPDLEKFKNAKKQEFTDVGNDVDAILNMALDMPEEDDKEDPALKLYLLDNPRNVEVSARDMIEAFYSVHDESKLDNEKSMEKFVVWVQENSLEALSTKLKAKYQAGLEDYDKLARRRRNLEDILTKFYLKHDRPKLDTRWTILKILSWTMQNGVVALNKKFLTRYGHPVVKDAHADIDNELDI